MCGIAGTVDPARRGGSDGCPHVTDMADALAHRGPDGRGRTVRGAFTVEVRRLALVGLDDGAQPVTNESGDVIVACNGEVYNYRELTTSLETAGHQFSTASDVEVIVHLYEEYGMELMHHLDGQFAFALYDSRIGTTFLVRDQFGICPLFYAYIGQGVAFSSEIAGLLTHPHIPTTLDLQGLYQVLTLPGPVSPQTLFEGVSSVPPGHYLQTTVDGQSTLVCYWDVNFPTDGGNRLSLDLDEAADVLTAVLARSTMRRLAADVPVGAYLSGGLDSALISVLAVATTGRRLPATFTIGYEEPKYDESRFSEMIARHVSDDHHRLVITADDIVANLPEAVRHSAAPLRESYNSASLMLSRRVREVGLKAVIGGEGADELFAGYPGYRFDALTRARGAKAPSSAERIAREHAYGSPELRYEHDLTQLHAWAAELLVPSALVGVKPTTTLVNPEMVRSRNRVDQRSYLDVKLRLADHLLADHGDRMAMANGVEMRYPFLGRGVADLARQLPPAVRLAGLEDKAVVRAAARRLVPREIVQREKFSWAAHGTANLLRAPLSPENADLLRHLLSPRRISQEGIFNPNAVSELVQRQRAERSYDANGVPDLLMVVATTGLFMETFGLTV